MRPLAPAPPFDPTLILFHVVSLSFGSPCTSAHTVPAGPQSRPHENSRRRPFGLVREPLIPLEDCGRDQDGGECLLLFLLQTDLVPDLLFLRGARRLDAADE